MTFDEKENLGDSEFESIGCSVIASFITFVMCLLCCGSLVSVFILITN